jgi:hypothetical protein
MMNRGLFIALAAVCAATAVAQPITIQNFEGSAPGAAQVMFRNPTFSGSTTPTHVANNPTFLTRVTDTFPGAPPLDPTSTRTLHSNWEWVDNQPSRWLRLTTFGSNVTPNPLLSFNSANPEGAIFRFNVWLSESAYMALMIRETPTATGPSGANGGTVGSISYLSQATAPLNPSGAPGGLLLQGGMWHTVTYNLGDPSAYMTRRFTGTGDFNPGNYSVLEALAITSAMGGVGSPAPIDMYLDNFQVVPEPASMAALGLGALGLMARRRRRNQK